MSTNDNMKTLSQVMNILAKRGITKEFCMNENCEMKLQGADKNYKPNDLRIAKTYRFEGDSNPSDNAILYVIEANDGNKGMIIDSYGAESNYPGEKFDEFMREIPVEENPEYNLD